MPMLTCLRGLPGSGKTTIALHLARTTDTIRVNRDELRMMMFGGKGILSLDKEAQVTVVERWIAADALDNGHSVVVDATNLDVSRLRDWNRFAHEHGAGFILHDVDTPLAECIRRDSARPRTVGDDVIRQMHWKHLQKGMPPYFPILGTTGSDKA